MFTVITGKGFRVEFPNGLAISVMFGPGNYCDNYSTPLGKTREVFEMLTSNDAECAVLRMKEEGEFDFVAFPGSDGQVRGHMNATEVADLMVWVASRP